MKRRSFDFKSNYSLNKKYEKKEIKRNTIIVDDYYTETNNMKGQKKAKKQ